MILRVSENIYVFIHSYKESGLTSRSKLSEMYKGCDIGPWRGSAALCLHSIKGVGNVLCADG